MVLMWRRSGALCFANRAAAEWLRDSGPIGARIHPRGLHRGRSGALRSANRAAAEWLCDSGPIGSRIHPRGLHRGRSGALRSARRYSDVHLNVTPLGST